MCLQPKSCECVLLKFMISYIHIPACQPLISCYDYCYHCNNPKHNWSSPHQNNINVNLNKVRRFKCISLKQFQVCMTCCSNKFYAKIILCEVSRLTAEFPLIIASNPSSPALIYRLSGGHAVSSLQDIWISLLQHAIAAPGTDEELLP